MTNIAYCILTYNNPDQVVRLVNRVQTESDFMYIHFDTMIGKQRFQQWKELIERKCPNKSLEIASKFRCKWGSFGLVDATLSSMRYYEDYNYDYFIDLSGDSYPLKSTEAIKKELNGQNCAFMDFFKLPYAGWWRGGLNRIRRRYYFLPRASYPYVRIFSIPRLRKGLPCGLKAYGGSAWFCLPKKHVSYVIRFVKGNPIVRKFFKRALIPDEMFFQTILLNSPLKSSVVNNGRIYVDWTSKEPHPKLLTKEDLENLKKSGKLFARKFDLSVDKGILDAIDQEIDKA